jgi:hypothetical protein
MYICMHILVYTYMFLNVYNFPSRFLARLSGIKPDMKRYRILTVRSSQPITQPSYVPSVLDERDGDRNGTEGEGDEGSYERYKQIHFRVCIHAYIYTYTYVHVLG